MKENRLTKRWCAHAALLAFACLQNAASAADSSNEPLHIRIDRLIDSARVGSPAPQAGDAEFLRRVFLDLSGLPPSVHELREFLADETPDKRARMIDTLLASPLFARHWATTLDVMLMERRPNVNVSAEEWQTYLLRAAQSNRPLNQVLSELLSANGADPKLRAPARFFLDRGSEPNLITRDVGRIFFGRDMQCAQCHNHPIVKDYQQSDYFGLLAFISPGYAVTRKEGKKDVTFHAERAGTDLAFDSVFVKNDKHVTGPRLPGEAEVPEPANPPGDVYQVKPADGVIAVPKFSRRAKLASLTTGGGNRAFNENIANRLWAVMMGRGLVHPIDLHHPSNPPSHPALLKLLADEIVVRNFNAREFLRELALTKVYQQAIDSPALTAPLPGQLDAKLAEEKARAEPLDAAAEAARKDYVSAVKAWYHIEDTLVPLLAEQDKATTKYAESEKKQEAAQKALTDEETQLTARRDAAKALAEAAGRTQEVVKKLPKEKELVDAAAIFTRRSAAASAELPALEKAILEKTAALKKAGDELAAATQSVLTARAKVSPVREAVRQKENITLQARRKMVETRSLAEDHQKRKKLLETFALCQKLQQRVAESDRAAIAIRNALTEVKKLQAALELHERIATSVQTALTATAAARRLLPADLALLEAAQKLSDKAVELRKAGLALQATIGASLESLDKVTEPYKPPPFPLQANRDEKTRRENALAAAITALESLETSAKTARGELAEALSELSTLRGSQFAQAQLKPLTPEQMCFSILKVTGVYDRYRKTEEAELDKNQPLVRLRVYAPLHKIIRAIELERRTYEKLKGNVAPFIRMYSAAPGQPQNDFFATADQALFAANGGSLNSWIAPAGGNISERMIQEKDATKAAEDLYMTILSRPPLPEESADVARMLTAGANEKAAVVQELVWGLLNSVEFRFNH
jgi:hypothetical protein